MFFILVAECNAGGGVAVPVVAVVAAVVVVVSVFLVSVVLQLIIADAKAKKVAFFS